ncbi:hypothetical protein QVD17_28201 [Tagetes erecta]|uniref:Uncharacterized protein n=1 Tax=Tagetes erecta TaxID=13708 RepID=A0AAD8K9X5_TARER|nr:hypothetical protein QVD17_28201 [Tagetes erecta]
MIPSSTTDDDNPTVDIEANVQPHVETNHDHNHNIFLRAALFLCKLRNNDDYLQGAFSADMPSSSFTFVITSLFAFTAIKSQGDTKFPFNTHPQAIWLSVTCVLLYGFASAGQYLVTSTARLGPNSVYAIVACLGRMVSLCILVVSFLINGHLGKIGLCSFWWDL